MPNTMHKFNAEIQSMVRVINPEIQENKILKPKEFKEKNQSEQCSFQCAAYLYLFQVSLVVALPMKSKSQAFFFFK